MQNGFGEYLLKENVN